MLEINMRDPVTNSMLLDTWTLVPCIVRAPNGPNSLRLSGNWMRRRLYTYTAPDMTDRLWIHTDRPLVKDMPKATANQRRAPLSSVQQSLVPLANYPTINTSYPDGIPPRPPRAAP
jgi:hypothetical protein